MTSGLTLEPIPNALSLPTSMKTLETKAPLFHAIHLHDRVMIQMPPRLTVVEAPAFREFVRGWIQQTPAPQQIILDFGQTTLIDSSGIGALLGNFKSARTHTVRLTLWSIGPQVQLAFSLAGLEEILSIEPHTEPTQPTVAPTSTSYSHLTHPSVRSKLKRALDIGGALVGLGIASILFVPIAIAIKLDSPGPVFFSQTRCGLLGKPFRIWKFRSMVHNAEALKAQVPNEIEGAFFKNQNDPRITRVGHFLRRTSLDELPQFWNILRGEMSLVGTRPPTLDEIEQYEVLNWRRLDVKPGLSGEWQVHGRSQVRSFEEVVQLDLRYQEHWSLLYDLKLILKTVLLIFKKESGAV
jgi:anti-anti-sigma factor